MHRLMIIGSVINILAAATSVIFFFIGRNASADAAAFLGGDITTGNTFFAVLSTIYPYFIGFVAVVAAIYIFFGIRREVTQYSKGFRKFLSIFLGFAVLWATAGYAFILGGGLVFQTTTFVPDATVSVYVKGIGGGLLGVGFGTFLTFLGCFKA